MDDKAEGEHTIQDDIAVAGQDFAAGLVRMGILPRICYLLEVNILMQIVLSSLCQLNKTLKNYCHAK